MFYNNTLMLVVNSNNTSQSFQKYFWLIIFKLINFLSLILKKFRRSHFSLNNIFSFHTKNMICAFSWLQNLNLHNLIPSFIGLNQLVNESTVAYLLQFKYTCNSLLFFIWKNILLINLKLNLNWISLIPILKIIQHP